MTIERIRISLRIASQVRSPEDIVTLLKIEPTVVHRIGEKMSMRNPSSTTRQENLVLIEFTSIRDTDFSEELLGVIRSLSEKRLELTTLKRDCDIEIFCGLFSDNGQGGFTLSSDNMAALHSLGIDVVFDFYA